MTNQTNPTLVEPVARLDFVDAIQSAITDLVQQYELIRMYDDAHSAHTLSDAELAQVLGTLESALRAGRKQGWWDSNERVMDELTAAIAIIKGRLK